MPDEYFVTYIMASERGALYIGVTNDMRRRASEHKQEIHKGSFTSRKQCKKLVYIERFYDPEEAIRHEKQLKKWSRKKKEWLIRLRNPHWRDMAGGWILPEAVPYEE